MSSSDTRDEDVRNINLDLRRTQTSLGQGYGTVIGSRAEDIDREMPRRVTTACSDCNAGGENEETFNEACYESPVLLIGREGTESRVTRDAAGEIAVRGIVCIF